MTVETPWITHVELKGMWIDVVNAARTIHSKGALPGSMRAFHADAENKNHTFAFWRFRPFGADIIFTFASSCGTEYATVRFTP